MKILLNENLPHAHRHVQTGHEVFTVAFQGWSGTSNGKLFDRAADAGFDLMLTMDNGVAYQQNLQTLSLSILILSAPSNDMEDMVPLIPQILAAIGTIRPRSVVRVG